MVTEVTLTRVFIWVGLGLQVGISGGYQADSGEQAYPQV